LNMRSKLLGIAAAIGLAGAAAPALADSNYGYDWAAGAVSANATLNVAINVPKVIILRVGVPNIADTITFDLNPNFVTTPASIPGTGAANNVAANWTGNPPVAPTGSVTAPPAVNAYLWHNNASTATLSCSTSGLVGAGVGFTDLTVASVGTLAHPGSAGTFCTPTTAGLARNVVNTGAWTFTFTGSFGAALPGAHTGAITYTATTI
jgi:hypothetical protein